VPNYNSKLQLNNTTLQTILNKINELPEESGGIDIDEELITQETLLSDQDAKLAELAEILSNKASASPGLQTCNVTITSVHCAIQEYFATAFTESDGIVPLYLDETGSQIPTSFTLSNVVCGSAIYLQHVIPVTFGYNVTGGAMLVKHGGYCSVFSIPQHPTDAIVITIRDDD
jgi:hypothetical protein